MRTQDNQPIHAVRNAMPRKLTISYDKVARSVQISSQGLFESQTSGRNHISIAQGAGVNECSTIEAAKRSKGIIVCSDAEGLRILNDPFCTIPLYYTESPTHFTASSDPQALIDYQTHPFDAVGVWETLLLNSPLWNRTPYQDIKFLPAACELKVGQEVKLQRYWNFEFEAASTGFNQRSFLHDFDDLLNQKFGAIQADSLCMGLSGGNDSRLAAHYLAKNKHHFSEIELITYAAHSNSNEFRYAREVASTLGLNRPRLHQLKDTHYLDALEYLPQWSAGQINNQHCHLTSYLKDASPPVPGRVHLSNYYTDAVFGWDCGKPQPMQDIHHASAYQTIQNATDKVPGKIIEEMLEDCQLALSPPLHAENYFSSLDEYKYLAERHPRFHISLAFIQSQYMTTTLPFADIDVISFAMQAPIIFRERKAILDELLKHINPLLAQIGNCGSHEYFHGTKSRLLHGSLTERLAFKKFRFLNMTTQLIGKMSGGTLRFGNPYQTEDQVSVYRKSFSRLAPAVVANKALKECLGETAMAHMLKDDVYLRNLAERFHLINFHHLAMGSN